MISECSQTIGATAVRMASQCARTCGFCNVVVGNNTSVRFKIDTPFGKAFLVMWRSARFLMWTRDTATRRAQLFQTFPLSLGTCFISAPSCWKWLVPVKPILTKCNIFSFYWELSECRHLPRLLPVPPWRGASLSLKCYLTRRSNSIIIVRWFFRSVLMRQRLSCWSTPKATISVVPGGVCEDSSSQCSSQKSLCIVPQLVNVMAQKCAKTCGFCRVVTGQNSESLVYSLCKHFSLLWDMYRILNTVVSRPSVVTAIQNFRHFGLERPSSRPTSPAP